MRFHLFFIHFALLSVQYSDNDFEDIMASHVSNYDVGDNSDIPIDTRIQMKAEKVRDFIRNDAVRMISLEFQSEIFPYAFNATDTLRVLVR
jgi:hypothetical protein